MRRARAKQMAYLSNLVLGTLAGMATLGAIGFASGNDLSGAARNDEQRAERADGSVASSVNRTVKTDRAIVALNVAAQPSQTFAVLPDRTANTSVLIRIPAQARTIEKSEMIRDRSAKSGERATSGVKSAIACEPVVSVLTEVASRLQPGRCVT